MARYTPRRWRGTLAIIIILCLVWLAGLFAFIAQVPRTAQNDDATDALVVLTGGPGRIDRGAELLAAGKAPQMLISGVGTDVRPRELLSAERLPDRLLSCCVTLGRAARDTHENAIETAGWAASRPISSIRLVTADFHMPRSVLEFERRLPSVTIEPEPVSTSNIRLDDWWRRPATALLLAGEYTKYLAARTQIALTRLIDGA
jgi:uncharacterized SAM-binding protein YcdF (DUF218 family)